LEDTEEVEDPEVPEDPEDSGGLELQIHEYI